MKQCDYFKVLIVSGATLLPFHSISAEEKVLETVIVIGDVDDLKTSELAGSVDVLSQEELRYEHVDDTLELFKKVPGVYLSRYNQGVINTDIAIRGFAGDGTTPHGKLLIDGIPSNFHNGYNELDQLFPLNIDSITVFKGTSDPRYGLFNTAGNYNVTTRQDTAKELEVTLGSFNTKEVQGYAGFENDSFMQSYSFGYRENKGYRDHTDLEKYALSGNWQWNIDDDKSFRVSVRHANYEGDSAGYLSKEQARENPEQSASFANQDGGDKEVNHISLHWDQHVSQDVQWSLKGYWQTFERERWVRFSQAGSLQDRFDDQTHYGLSSTINWSLSDEWFVDWGVNYEAQDVLEQRFGTIGQTRTRDTSNVIRDLDYDFNTYGTYVKLIHEPNEKVRWNVALRADRIDGDLRPARNAETRDTFDFGTILQPKFNIVYSPVERFNVFANLGRSFQHPFGSAAYATNDRNARDVSINDGWELGAQWSPSQLLTLRVSFWEQKATDEFVVVDGTSRNVGETERNGFDLAFNGAVNDAFSYWGSYTSVNSEILKTSSVASATEGNELRSIPEYTISLGANYQFTPKFVTRLHLDSQGDYFINENNLGGKFGEYTLLNASADYDAGWGIIKLQLNNLTDEEYEYVFDFSDDGTSTIHSPGDGINGSVSVNVKF